MESGQRCIVSRHSSHLFSKRRFRHASTSIRIHADRAAGGDRHHRGSDRSAAACGPGGPRGRPPLAVHQQPEAARVGGAQLHPDEQRAAASNVVSLQRGPELGMELRLAPLPVAVPGAGDAVQRLQLLDRHVRQRGGGYLPAGKHNGPVRTVKRADLPLRRDQSPAPESQRGDQLCGEHGRPGCAPGDDRYDRAVHLPGDARLGRLRRTSGRSAWRTSTTAPPTRRSSASG